MQLRLGGGKKKHRAVLTQKKETVPTVSAKGFKSVNKTYHIGYSVSCCKGMYAVS